MQSLTAATTKPLAFAAKTSTAPMFGGAAQTASPFDLLMTLGMDTAVSGVMTSLGDGPTGAASSATAAAAALFGSDTPADDTENTETSASSATAGAMLSWPSLTAVSGGVTADAGKITGDGGKSSTGDADDDGDTSTIDAMEAMAMMTGLCGNLTAATVQNTSTPVAADATADGKTAGMAFVPGGAAEASTQAQADTGATISTAAATAEPSTDFVWNLADLLHPLRNAVQQVMTDAGAPAEAPTAPSLVAQAAAATAKTPENAATQPATISTALTGQTAATTAAAATVSTVADTDETPGESSVIADPAADAADGLTQTPKVGDAISNGKLTAERLIRKVQGTASHGKENSAIAAAMQDGAREAAPAGATMATTDGVTQANSIINQVQHVTDLLANRLEGSVRTSGQRVEASMRLNPPDLGGVRIELNMTADSTVQARFTADRPSTAQLIQQNVSQLQDGLTRQGLVVDRIQVGVQATASTTSSQSNDMSWNQSGQDTRRQDAQSRSFQERQTASQRDRENPEWNESFE